MLNENLEELLSQDINTSQEAPALFGMKDEDKIEAFEKSLAAKLRDSDSIPEAVNKMVTAALSVEFGDKLLGSKQAANMIRLISDSILCESDLRKQALLIIDKLSKAEELNA